MVLRSCYLESALIIDAPNKTCLRAPIMALISNMLYVEAVPLFSFSITHEPTILLLIPHIPPHVSH